MKILHIGTTIEGGAGLGMLRLHRDLLTRGVDSKILCLRRKGDDDERIYGYLDDDRINGRFKRSLLAAVLNRMHLYSAPIYKYARAIKGLPKDTMVSSPYTGYKIHNLKLIEEADVINLHWIVNFIDYPTFFKAVNKPIVWTLRDENPALGLWHFRQDIPKELPPSINELDALIRKRKAKWISQAKRLAVVSLSRGEDVFFAESNAFAGRMHRVIPNSIDGELFFRHDRNNIRKEYGIQENAIVLVFVAQHLSEARKGLSDLLQALKILDLPDVVLICVGSGEVPTIQIPNRILSVGKISDMSRLSAVFSASDLFVSPSYAETFGKTLTEALACGVPVVSYPNAGARDIIVDENDGIVCESFTVHALAQAITKALSHSYDKDTLRQRVLKRFSNHTVVNSYCSIYTDILH
jgi:glycosyltransferase involved in cell wall biosynthesis